MSFEKSKLPQFIEQRDINAASIFWSQLDKNQTNRLAELFSKAFNVPYSSKA